MNNFRMPYRIHLGPPITKQIKLILILNLAVFIIQQLDHDAFISLFSLQPYKVIHQFQVWRLVTYAFLHGSLGHIFFNMFSLWMFGRDVENALGEKQFIRYYLLTAVGAGILHMLFSWDSTIPVLGASGAIFGIVIAYAVLFPYRELFLLLFFIIPIRMKAKTLAIIYFSIALYMGIKSHMFGTHDGVAHLAHLGGALTGFILLKWNSIFGQLQKKNEQKRAEKKSAHIRKENENLAKVKKQVDDILDHINQVGYANISREEKKTLREASDYLAKMENSRNR